MGWMVPVGSFLSGSFSPTVDAHGTTFVNVVLLLFYPRPGEKTKKKKYLEKHGNQAERAGS